MIPANIDYLAIVRDLNTWGYGCYKIDTICGFSEGYTVKLLDGSFRDMTYQRAARLYNFWCDEMDLRDRQALVRVNRLVPEDIQVLLPTT